MQPRGTEVELMIWKLESENAEAVEASMRSGHTHLDDNLPSRLAITK
jgi:hypothetical protein